MDNDKTKILLGGIATILILIGIIIGVNIYKKNIYMEPLASFDEKSDNALKEQSSEITSFDISDQTVDSNNTNDEKSALLNEDANIKTIDESATEGVPSEESAVENLDNDSQLIPTAIGTYKPSEVYNFCNEQSISDALFNYTVNQNEDYAHEVAVNLGEVFPEKYKDIDLDEDGTIDSISRIIGHTGDGCIYSFEFGNGISFVSAPYTIAPNEGELISFYDFNNDKVDEILITHITDSTGGPLAWNCELYIWTGSGWESQWAVDENGAVGLSGVDEVLSKECNSYHVRDVEFAEDGIMYLIDYGQKNGSELELDLETIQIMFFGKDLYMEERYDFDKRDELTNKILPLGI